MSRAKPSVARVPKPPRAALFYGGVALLVVVAFAAALTYGQRDRLSRWLKARIEGELSLAVGGEVRIGRLDLNLLRLQADIKRLDLSIPAEGAVPLTASVESCRVRLAWQGLGSLAAGRIRLREMVLARPMIVVRQASLESHRPVRQGRPIDIRIDHFELSRGTLLY